MDQEQSVTSDEKCSISDLKTMSTADEDTDMDKYFTKDSLDTKEEDVAWRDDVTPENVTSADNDYESERIIPLPGETEEKLSYANLLLKKIKTRLKRIDDQQEHCQSFGKRLESELENAKNTIAKSRSKDTVVLKHAERPVRSAKPAPDA